MNIFYHFYLQRAFICKTLILVVVFFSVLTNLICCFVSVLHEQKYKFNKNINFLFFISPDAYLKIKN